MFTKSSSERSSTADVRMECIFSEYLLVIEFRRFKIKTYVFLLLRSFVIDRIQSNNLQALNVTTLSTDDCKRVNPNHNGNIELCSVKPLTRRTFLKEFGSALVFKNELVGITIWTEPFTTGDLHGYAKLSYYFPWIESKIWSYSKIRI